MSRFRGPTAKYASYIVVSLVFVYGMYSYHGVSTQLRSVEDKLSHVSQQHDSVSAQLQGNHPSYNCARRICRENITF